MAVQRRTQSAAIPIDEGDYGAPPVSNFLPFFLENLAFDNFVKCAIQFERFDIAKY